LEFRSKHFLKVIKSIYSSRKQSEGLSYHMSIAKGEKESCPKAVVIRYQTGSS